MRTVNMVWAFDNIAAIPSPLPDASHPLVAGGHGVLSFFVVSNSLRLRKFKDTRQAAEPLAGHTDRAMSARCVVG